MTSSTAIFQELFLPSEQVLSCLVAGWKQTTFPCLFEDEQTYPSWDKCSIHGNDERFPGSEGFSLVLVQLLDLILFVCFCFYFPEILGSKPCGPWHPLTS